MEFIIDIQGFKSDTDDFIVKELALISTDARVYELHIFQPHCNFDYLPPHLQKQVLWSERRYNGLFWGTGFKEYKQLEDLFANVQLQGDVYVKGREKQKYITKLFSKFDVNVINFEDLGCPPLQDLKSSYHQFQLIKPCNFNHNPFKCAYVNVHFLLQWWTMEKLVDQKLERVNLALRDCYRKGLCNMNAELVQYLPKEFIINHHEDIENIYCRLPEKMKNDYSVLLNLRCSDHYVELKGDTFDGPNPKRKHCPLCIKDFYQTGQSVKFTDN